MDKRRFPEISHRHDPSSHSEAVGCLLEGITVHFPEAMHCFRCGQISFET
jgi:hypothetical protein